MINNQIITKGFSRINQNSIVTKGYVATAFEQILEFVRRITSRSGKSSKKTKEEYNRIDEVVVATKLISINESELYFPIKNQVKLSFDNLRQININIVKKLTFVRSYLNEIKITIGRVK